MQIAEAEIFGYSSNSIYIQLYFYDTSIISKNVSEPTTIVGTINVSDFKDIDGNTPQPASSIVFKELPP